MQIIASGTREIEALKAEVSALEKQLKEMHEKDSSNMEAMAVDKDQIEKRQMWREKIHHGQGASGPKRV